MQKNNTGQYNSSIRTPSSLIYNDASFRVLKTKGNNCSIAVVYKKYKNMAITADIKYFTTERPEEYKLPETVEFALYLADL